MYFRRRFGSRRIKRSIRPIRRKLIKRPLFKRRFFKKKRYSFGFPKVAHTKLKLCSDLISYTSAQTYADWKFPLNNPWKPVVDELPNNYENLATIYAKHFCSGGYYRVTIMNAAANDTCSIAYCINNDATDYPSATTGFRTTAQSGRTRYCSNVGNGAGNKLIIKGRWNINKYMKVKQRWDELLLPVNTAPAAADTVWLHFSGKNSNTDTFSIRIIYEAWFNVHWYQELADEADEDAADGGELQTIQEDTKMVESKTNIVNGKKLVITK